MDITAFLDKYVIIYRHYAHDDNKLPNVFRKCKNNQTSASSPRGIRPFEGLVCKTVARFVY